MKRFILTVTVGAIVLSGGAVIGATGASAAQTAPTIVITERSAVFGVVPGNIVATASAPGTVAFSADAKAIIGCETVATSTAAPFVAKCAWIPSHSGPTILVGVLTPADSAAFSVATSPAFTTKVGVAVQGDPVSPIHIYADTVLASGGTGVLAPKFGTGCAITSEYIMGQTIVFRVYANNENIGGATMTPLNTAQAYITVPGVTDPIVMSYGNHSGVAFWVGVLKTGATPLYNTLGLIDYKVTMVGKDTDTVKVLSTHLVAVMKDGKRVVKDGHVVMQRVAYYRNQKLSTPVSGAVGSWRNNFTTASWLTLNALPLI
jgi:hypothetical protein